MSAVYLTISPDKKLWFTIERVLVKVLIPVASFAVFCLFLKLPGLSIIIWSTLFLLSTAKNLWIPPPWDNKSIVPIPETASS